MNTGWKEHQRELRDRPGQVGGGGQGGGAQDQPGRPPLLCQWCLPGFFKLNSLDFQKSDVIIFWSLTQYPQGVAASNLPTTVFAVIDMYGKCAQVTFFLQLLLQQVQQIMFQVSLMDNSVQEAR